MPEVCEEGQGSRKWKTSNIRGGRLAGEVARRVAKRELGKWRVGEAAMSYFITRSSGGQDKLEAAGITGGIPDCGLESPCPQDPMAASVPLPNEIPYSFNFV